MKLDPNNIVVVVASWTMVVSVLGGLAYLLIVMVLLPLVRKVLGGKG